VASGIKQYGNSIKDVSKAQGPRASTAQNPLGLASTQAGAKAQWKYGGQKKQTQGTASNPLGLK